MVYISGMERKYYVYAHYSNGKIFYVGIGKKPIKFYGPKTQYPRAYAMVKRNSVWYLIATRRPYTVEIISDNLSYLDGLQLERDLITKHGRLVDYSGCLANYQNTASGALNPQQIILKIRQLDLSGNLVKIWDTPISIETSTGFLRTNVVKCCRKKQVTAYGYKWEYANCRLFDNVKATTSRIFPNKIDIGRLSKKKNFSVTKEQIAKIKNKKSYTTKHN